MGGERSKRPGQAMQIHLSDLPAKARRAQSKGGLHGNLGSPMNGLMASEDTVQFAHTIAPTIGD